MIVDGFLIQAQNLTQKMRLGTHDILKLERVKRNGKVTIVTS